MQYLLDRKGLTIVQKINEVLLCKPHPLLLHYIALALISQYNIYK